MPPESRPAILSAWARSSTCRQRLVSRSRFTVRCGHSMVLCDSRRSRGSPEHPPSSQKASRPVSPILKNLTEFSTELFASRQELDLVATTRFFSRPRHVSRAQTRWTRVLEREGATSTSSISSSRPDARVASSHALVSTQLKMTEKKDLECEKNAPPNSRTSGDAAFSREDLFERGLCEALDGVVAPL